MKHEEKLREVDEVEFYKKLLKLEDERYEELRNIILKTDCSFLRSDDVMTLSSHFSTEFIINHLQIPNNKKTEIMKIYKELLGEKNG